MLTDLARGLSSIWMHKILSVKPLGILSPYEVPLGSNDTDMGRYLSNNLTLCLLVAPVILPCSSTDRWTGLSSSASELAQLLETKQVPPGKRHDETGCHVERAK